MTEIHGPVWVVAEQSGNEVQAVSLQLIGQARKLADELGVAVEVILLGDRMLYYLLYQYDQDFGELFKVAADFEDEIDRNPEN